VNPDLVVRGENGKVMTVRSEAVNAMLLNEFLKGHQRATEEHRIVEQQQATIAELKFSSLKQAAMVDRQQKQIEAVTATVQKASDQLAISKPPVELVATP